MARRIPPGPGRSRPLAGPGGTRLVECRPGWGAGRPDHRGGSQGGCALSRPFRDASSTKSQRAPPITASRRASPRCRWSTPTFSSASTGHGVPRGARWPRGSPQPRSRHPTRRRAGPRRSGRGSGHILRRSGVRWRRWPPARFRWCRSPTSARSATSRVRQRTAASGSTAPTSRGSRQPESIFAERALICVGGEATGLRAKTRRHVDADASPFRWRPVSSRSTSRSRPASSCWEWRRRFRAYPARRT